MSASRRPRFKLQRYLQKSLRVKNAKTPEKNPTQNAHAHKLSNTALTRIRFTQRNGVANSEGKNSPTFPGQFLSSKYPGPIFYYR